MSADEGPLAIVAGHGGLPWEAAARVAPRRRVVVFAIEGEASAGPPGIETHRFRFGELGRFRKLMLAMGCRDVVFLGAIRSRPDFRALLPDAETLMLLPKLLRAVVGGDDSVVRKALAIVEAEGFRVVPVGEAVPELVAEAGRYGRTAPDAEHETDIALGTRFLDATAAFDVGQAVAVATGRIVAVEGAEGTDAMIARCGQMAAARRVRCRRGGLVLVKRAKRGQDLRTELPVVGAQTLAAAVSAGFGGMAIEAGRTIVAERAALVAAADKAGVFVVAR